MDAPPIRRDPHGRTLPWRGLLASLLCLSLAPSPLARAGDGGDVDARSSAALAGEGRTIVLHGTGERWTYGIEGWRNWAREHLAEQVASPLSIGPRTVRADDFDRFGVAAPSPDGEALFFSATTYAMLTTLSIVGVLEPGPPADGEEPHPVLMPEPRRGDVEEPSWAPASRRIAYALGTARARGEALYVDDLEARRTLLELTRQDMHAIWHGADLPLGTRTDAKDPNAYAPKFRDLAWDAGGERLSFTADPPGTPWEGAAAEDEAGPQRWSVRADGQDLRHEGSARSHGGVR